ncbi:MAG: hypothetical protein V9E83_13495 [Baekduia sp.]
MHFSDEIPRHVVSLSDALTAAELPFAFGAAVALGQAAINDPREPPDIDVHVFIDRSDAAMVLAALPDDLPRTADFADSLLFSGYGVLAGSPPLIEVILRGASADARDRVELRHLAAGTSVPVLALQDVRAWRSRGAPEQTGPGE